jgi:hypothetical protein
LHNDDSITLCVGLQELNSDARVGCWFDSRSMIHIMRKSLCTSFLILAAKKNGVT